MSEPHQVSEGPCDMRADCTMRLRGCDCPFPLGYRVVTLVLALLILLGVYVLGWLPPARLPLTPVTGDQHHDFRLSTKP